MGNLSARDFHRLLNFLEQAYSTRDQASYIHCVLEGLPKLLPTNMTSYSEMNASGGASQHWTDPALSKVQESIWPEVMGEHAVLMYQAKTHDGRTYKLSDFLTRQQYQRTRLYNEFYKQHGVEEQMGCLVALQDPMLMGIAVHRSRRTFNERDRLVLDLLRPHLAQAWRNAKTFADFWHRSNQSREALDQCESGIASIEADGRIIRIGEVAQRLLVEFFGCSPAHRELPDDLKRWIVCQGKCNDKTVIPLPREPLVVQKAGKRLVARLLNVEGQFQLLLQKQLSGSRQNEAFAQKLGSLGITEREAEVLEWVRQGKSNADIAVILGISARTVQKHVEHIFQKLGVETRTAAACRILGTA